MECEPDRQKNPPDLSIEEINAAVWTLAEKYQDDTFELLGLLRDLEQLHRQIRVEFFEQCLPQTRQHLYQLAKEIEESGGWPYIERMRLRDLLKKMNFQEDNTAQNSTDESISSD
jgi:hypothetical protein